MQVDLSTGLYYYDAELLVGMDESGMSGFFVNRDVGIVFALLLIFPALTYFAVTVPSIIPGIESEAISWLITLVVLYLEAVVAAALYRTVLR